LIYLAILLLAPFFAVAIVQHFTASPIVNYRAAQDPVCQQLRYGRQEIVAEHRRDGSVQSSEATKQIDDRPARLRIPVVVASPFTRGDPTRGAYSFSSR